jgi:hypothetical protein
MTRHTVIWVPSAEDELGELWLAAMDQEEIANAANTIDRVLRDQAEDAGEEVAEDLRGLDCPPLRVLFEVLADDLIVRILKVKRI